jgi:MFS family permease
MAFCNGLMVPIMPLYAASFGASYGLIGVVLAAAGIGTLVSDVPAGLLVHRLGTKRVMLLGGLCTVVGVLALAWASTIYEVVLYRMFAGVGTALWGIARHAYVADIIKSERRGRSIAVLGGIGRLGIFLGPAAGGVAAQVYGLRAPFVAFAALGLVALLAVQLWVRDGGGIGAKGGHLPRHPLGKLVRTHGRVLAAAGSGQLLAQMIRRARHVIIPLYAADVLGLEVQAVGLVISIASAVDMTMFYPAGVLMDRLGRKYAYVPSFAIQALGMLLIPLTDSFASLVLAACVIGLGNGLGSGTMMTLGADLAPPQDRGEFLGVWRFIGDAGGAGGPLVIGAMAGALGLIHTPVLMAAVGLAGAAVLGFAVPETLDRRKQRGAPTT